MTAYAGSAAFPWRRVSFQVCLAAFYLGMARVFLLIPVLDDTAGLVLVQAGLLLTLILAPLEFGLGALGCAFLAAASPALGEMFRVGRWTTLGAALAVLSVRFFLRRRSGHRPTPNLFEFLLLVFAGFAAFSAFTSVSALLSGVKLLALLCLFLVLSLAAHRLVDAYGPAAPRRLVVGLLTLTLPFLAIPIFGWITGLGPSVLNDRGLFTGHVGNPNTWASLVAVGLPWMVAPLVRGSRPWRLPHVGLAVALVVVLYTLLLSTSRAATLGVAGAIAVFFLIHTERKMAMAALVLVIMFSARVMADPGYLADLTKRYIRKSSVAVLSSRTGPWQTARRYFQENPWTGIGFGVSNVGESRWNWSVQSVGAIETGSSIWGSLAQVGLLGTSVLFLAILLLLARAGRFAYRVKDPWLTALYSSVIALTASAVFEGWLIAPGSFTSTYFWLQCFILNAMTQQFRPASPRHRPWPGGAELDRVYAGA